MQLENVMLLLIVDVFSVVQNALPIELLFVRGLDGELVSQDGVTQVNVTAGKETNALLVKL